MNGETVIILNDKERVAVVETENFGLRIRLEAMADEYPNFCYRQDGAYILPKSWVRINPPGKLDICEMRRRELVERLNAIKAAQGGENHLPVSDTANAN